VSEKKERVLWLGSKAMFDFACEQARKDPDGFGRMGDESCQDNVYQRKKKAKVVQVYVLLIHP